MFQQNCAVCHADDGSGSMPGVPDLVEDQSWKKIPQSQLFKKLVEGSQNMPPRGGNAALEDEQLEQILQYMRNKF